MDQAAANMMVTGSVITWWNGMIQRDSFGLFVSIDNAVGKELAS